MNRSSLCRAVLLNFGVFGTAAFGQVDAGAEKAQALTDVRNILNATLAFENEYGKLPPAVQRKKGESGDVTVGHVTMGAAAPNSALFYILRAIALGPNTDDMMNRRKTKFFDGPVVKDANKPRGGFLDGTKGAAEQRGCFFDPWGREYMVRLDEDYSGTIKTPDHQIVDARVIVWSVGLDGISGTADDVKTWK